MVRYAIWCHLYNFKKLKNTHGGVVILVKLQAPACNFTKIKTPPWVFFTFFKWYKWCQIAQCTTNIHELWHQALIVMKIKRFWKNSYLFHDGDRYHVESSPLICSAYQWTAFYMITASVMKELSLLISCTLHLKLVRT